MLRAEIDRRQTAGDEQAILYDEHRRFTFVVPEAALRWRFGPRDLLLGQLDRLSVGCESAEC